MDGHEVEQWVELSLDGELAVEEQDKLHRQLSCSPEATRVFETERRFQTQFRSKLRSASADIPTPSHLRAQVTEILQRDQNAERGRGWGRVTAASLALAGLAVVSWVTVHDEFDPEGPVALHSTNPPPDVRPRGNPAKLRSFFRGRLGFEPSIPSVEGRIPNLRLVGARLAHFRNREAAYLMYEQRGARISVFAFPKQQGLRQPEHFISEHAGGRTVLVGRHRGYNVTYFEDNGLVYSVVGDVEPMALKQVAASF